MNTLESRVEKLEAVLSELHCILHMWDEDRDYDIDEPVVSLEREEGEGD